MSYYSDSPEDFNEVDYEPGDGMYVAVRWPEYQELWRLEWFHDVPEDAGRVAYAALRERVNESIAEALTEMGVALTTRPAPQRASQNASGVPR